MIITPMTLIIVSAKSEEKTFGAAAMTRAVKSQGRGERDADVIIRAFP